MDNTPRTFALLLNSPLQYSTVRYSSHAERIELDQERTVFYLYYIYICTHIYRQYLYNIYLYHIYTNPAFSTAMFLVGPQRQKSQQECSENGAGFYVFDELSEKKSVGPPT